MVENTPKDLELRLSAFLHDIGKPPAKATDQKGIDHFYGHGDKSAKMTQDILHRLRLDNQTIKNVVRLVKLHDAEIDGSPYSIRKVASRIGEDLFLKLIALERADCAGQNPHKVQGKLDDLDRAEEYFVNNRAEMALTIAGLAVNGADLIGIGIKKGPDVGRTLNTLLKAVIKDPKLNKKESLLKLAKGIGN